YHGGYDFVVLWGSNMSKFNDFFKKVATRPSLMWKLAAGMVFIILAAMVLFLPTMFSGLSDTSRYAFSTLLAVYSLYRLSTFFMEYNQRGDE
ncbi:MAG TPA: hypothetical protein VG603_10205, partial [Chitinophagales bacterium]|nr:hypothetical protein [Chitinophagales bacterium]